MIAIVVHLELPQMFKSKILIKSKSEITGLKKTNIVAFRPLFIS